MSSWEVFWPILLQSVSSQLHNSIGIVTKLIFVYQSLMNYNSNTLLMTKDLTFALMKESLISYIAWGPIQSWSSSTHIMIQLYRYWLHKTNLNRTMSSGFLGTVYVIWSPLCLVAREVKYLSERYVLHAVLHMCDHNNVDVDFFIVHQDYTWYTYKCKNKQKESTRGTDSLHLSKRMAFVYIP